MKLIPHRATPTLPNAIQSLIWVGTLDAPELIVPDPDDAAIERCFRRIPEFGGRVLRVAVNRTVEPQRVVSVFFDRKMKGKL